MTTAVAICYTMSDVNKDGVFVQNDQLDFPALLKRTAGHIAELID